jgi:hypothetical protein
MSNCTISEGLALQCRNSTGGIRTVYLANFNDNETYSLDANNQITGITSGATYYKFEVRPQTAGFTEQINSSVENGTLFFTQELSLSFDKNTAELRNQIYLLSQAQMKAIILDQNGTYRLIGKVNGADVVGGTIPTGTAYGDRNGVELNITAYEPQPSHFISAAAFATLNIGQ